MIIKVIRKNQFNVLFDMVTDDLPDEGEYILVPAGKSQDFAFKVLKEMLDKVLDAEAVDRKIEKIKQELEWDMKQLRQALELLKGKP